MDNFNLSNTDKNCMIKSNSSSSLIDGNLNDNEKCGILILESKDSIIPISEKSNNYTGLYNQGNTCYLNSLLQVLFMSPIFREKLFSWEYNEKNGTLEDCIPFQLQKLFARLNQRYFSSESTEDLTKSFQWGYSQVNEQHDIQELCRVLFNAMELSADSGFLSDLFEGSTESVVKCLECNYESVTVEKYLDLSLPIRNEFDKLYNTSLEMAILNVIKEENLVKENQYLCCKCNKLVDAKKFVRFKKTPDILFIQLSRFDFDYLTDCRKKIHDRLTFPKYLNFERFTKLNYDELKNFYDENRLKNLALMNKTNYSFNSKIDDINVASLENYDEYYYELYGIMIHAGNAQKGHYYSFINSFEDQKWYKFDDHIIYIAHEEELLSSFGGSDNSYGSSTAYFLAYNKVKKNQTNLYNSFDQFKFNKHLHDYIKEENVKVGELNRQREERMNTLTIKFNVKGVTHNLEVKKYNSIKELKLKILDKGILNFSDDENLSKLYQSYQLIKDSKDQLITNEINELINILTDNFRIRNFYLGKMTEVVIYNSEETKLEELGFYNHKSYSIEVKSINENFEDYDPDKITIQIHTWNNSESADVNASLFKQLKINKKVNYKVFIESIVKYYNENFQESVNNLKENCNIDGNNKNLINSNDSDEFLHNLIIFTKNEYGFNNFKIRELYPYDKIIQEYKSKRLPLKNVLENEIKNLSITDNMKVYIEKESCLNKSKFLSHFEEMCLNVKIYFNFPLLKGIKPKVGSYSFENEIEIKKTKTLKEMKKRIAEIINIPTSEFLIRKNTHNGIELKNLSESIDKHTSSQMKIFVEIGTPMKESEIKITAYLCEENYATFNVIPYKISKICDFSADLIWDFIELKQSLLKIINENIIKIEEQNLMYNTSNTSNPNEENIAHNNNSDLKVKNINQNPSMNKNKFTKPIINNLNLENIKKNYDYLKYMINSNNDQIFLRDFYNEKPTFYFQENLLLKDYDFKSGKIIVIQERNKLTFDLISKNINDSLEYLTSSKEKLQVTFRKLDLTTLSLSTPIDVFLPRKNIQNSYLFKVVNFIYPEIHVSFIFI